MDQSVIAVIVAVIAILFTLYLSTSQTSSTQKDVRVHPHGESTKMSPTVNNKNTIPKSTTGITKENDASSSTSHKYAAGNWRSDNSDSLTELLAQTRSGCDIPVIRSKDDQHHIERLIHLNIPFVVKGFAHDWPAKSSWTKSSLLQKYGNRVIKQDSETSIVHNSGGVSQGITFEKYLDQLEMVQENQGKQSDFFVFDTEILHAIPELRDDVIIPSFVSDWDNRNNEASKSMWHMLSIGPSKSGLPLHSHGKTWISLVHGSKKWFLYPPGYNLPDSIGRECHALCTVSQWLQEFYPKMDTLPHIYDVSKTARELEYMEKMNAIDIDNYIKIFEEVYGFNHHLNESSAKDTVGTRYFKPLECVQEAGDLVYLPDQWLHLTFNIGETIGYGGQSALNAQQRFDQAREILQRSPDDFNLLRDFALGASHLLIDHSNQVRSYGQYFDQIFKVLVFDSMQKTKEFAKLTEDPIIIFELLSQPVNKNSLTISGKSVLTLLNSVVFSEDMHRFDTIVVLPKEFAPNQKKSMGSPLLALQTRRLSLDGIKIHFYHADEKNTKTCPLQLNDSGDAIDDHHVLSCLVSSLNLLVNELKIEDVSLLGDEKGGSSNYTRTTYHLVKDTLQKAIAKRSSSLEAWRLLAEVAGMVGDYTQMENAITEANNIYDDILKKSVEDGALISKRSAAAIYHQLATSFMAVEMGKPALPLLEKTLKLAPDYGPAWIDRVVAAGMAKNKGLAAEKLNELKQRFPKHPAITQLTKYVKQLGSRK